MRVHENKRVGCNALLTQINTTDQVDFVDVTIPDKTYFRIGEVSKLLGVETYVVRYWESEFKSIKPMRTGSDQRRYRKKDVEELLLIRDLLYREGFTIAGAKKRLSELKKNKEEIRPKPLFNSDDCMDRLVDIKKRLTELKKIVG